MNKETLLNINKNVKKLLIKYRWARNIKQRKLAIYKYYQEFCGIGEFGITKEKWLKIPNPETISRAIRKIQEQNPDLRGEEDIERYRQSNLYAGLYGKKNYGTTK